MANVTVGTWIGGHPGQISDKRKTPTSNNQLAANVINNDYDIAAMRARLTAINSGKYTVSVLNMMSSNDMLFAIRTEDDPNSF